jgi:hypothetical protein
VLGERVHDGGIRIGNQQHVGFIDGLKTPDARAVKADPFFK